MTILRPDAKARHVVALVDMNFFNLVSRYYRFENERSSWPNLPGVLDFARRAAAERKAISPLHVDIVSAKAYIGAAGFRVVNGSSYTVLPTRYFEAVRRSGIDIELGEYEFNREINVDQRLQYDLIQAAQNGMDVLLFAGDSDHLDAVRVARSLGAFVTQVGWHIPGALGSVGIGCSEALRGACDLCLRMEELIGRPTPHENPLKRELFVATATTALVGYFTCPPNSCQPELGGQNERGN